ncbi:MAG: hypothetical protein PHX93_02110 [Candidatus Peribacteraceae bacterium]|jgi:glutaredoxin|nr:hypothetical protein [Candidatus Peribacteraceae bacterium]
MDSADFSSSGRSKGLLKPVIGGIAVIVFLAAVFFIARSSGSALPGGMVLYYGDGCPHCANVEAFVQGNDVESKVSFSRKEVYLNKSNARELARVAKHCGLPTDSIAVPLFWTATQCLTGDKDIIAFFQQQL